MGRPRLASATTSVGASTLRADGPDGSPLAPLSSCAVGAPRLRGVPAIDAGDIESSSAADVPT